MSDKLTNGENVEEAAIEEEVVNELLEAVETEAVVEAVEAEVVAEEAIAVAVEAEAIAEEAEEVAEVLMAENADEETVIDAISIAIEAEAVAAEAEEVAVEAVAEAIVADAAAEVAVETVEAVEAVEEAPAVEAVRGPSGYVESEGGRPSRIGSGVKVGDIDYKNIALLSRFLDRRGRILSRRKTRVSAKVQRRVAQAIKRARHLALLPYTSDQTRVVRKRR